MALKSTIFKAELQIADIDRGYYATHNLTIARHPSETDERMMVRLLAFALFAEERLTFGGGISSEDEPALWARNLTDDVTLWIEVGLPDERRLRRACGRAERVVVVAYGGRPAAIWWQQNRSALAHLDKLSVIEVPEETSLALAALAERSMRIQCTHQDDDWWINIGDGTLALRTIALQESGRQQV